jgi:hypothetical protein
MSIEEYQQMQQEVRWLFEVFSYDYTKSVYSGENYLKRIQLPFYPQQQFQELLSQFLDCFNEISKMPEQELIQIEKKISLHQVKKWTSSIIIENEIKQNGKVTASISEKTIDIKEHRMIRFMVKEFQQRIDMELGAELKYLNSLQDELQQLENVEKMEQSSPLASNFRSLIEIVNSDCEKLEHRIDIWENMKRQIDELLNQPLLQCESQVIEETHLFRMHPLYSEIYSLYIDYENLSPVLSDTFRLFIQSILKSPTLYEIWILLKIIEKISHWGVNYNEFIKDLQEKYLNQKTISGYKKLFKLADKPFDIAIYYDYPVNEKEYRPDFVIGFFDKERKKWYMHTLDAKYKCYSKMKKGEQKILYDLEHSGTRYLNELFKNDPRIILKSATLVHPDVDSINWNVKHPKVNPNHRQHYLAHFYFTPNKNTNANLDIFFKRLLHECSQFKECCPYCAEKVEGKKEEPKIFKNKVGLKTTFICRNCEVVWVSNYCSTCFFEGRRMIRIEKDNKIWQLSRPLYKYSHYNYNLQVEDKWDVHCPTCNKTADHRLNYNTQEDLLKGTIIISKKREL